MPRKLCYLTSLHHISAMDDFFFQSVKSVNLGVIQVLRYVQEKKIWDSDIDPPSPTALSLNSRILIRREEENKSVSPSLHQGESRSIHHARKGRIAHKS